MAACPSPIWPRVCSGGEPQVGPRQTLEAAWEQAPVPGWEEAAAARPRRAFAASRVRRPLVVECGKRGLVGVRGSAVAPGGGPRLLGAASAVLRGRTPVRRAARADSRLKVIRTSHRSSLRQPRDASLVIARTSEPCSRRSVGCWRVVAEERAVFLRRSADVPVEGRANRGRRAESSQAADVLDRFCSRLE